MDFLDNENMKEMMALFQVESEEIIEKIFNDLDLLSKNMHDREVSANLYRELHSLKGAVRMVGFNNIQTIIHRVEDIFDAINDKKYVPDSDAVNIIYKTIEAVSGYIQESVQNEREIIDENFQTLISNIEYIVDVEIPEQQQNGVSQDVDSIVNDVSKDKFTEHQEEINQAFNNSFGIIDAIVPEEEATDIVLLKEEVQKIYDFFKDTDIYEIKSSLENVITKIDFVMNASNTLTISEILELRNELSSAAAKFTTICVETQDTGLTFFDVAEKISMLQGSSVYTGEIKADILSLKENIDDSNVLEVINTIVDILDFITENSVQLEEQMVLTLKSGLEYCAVPNENIDSELIVQQLEIMKQLLELNYKKDSGLSETKSFLTQNVPSAKATSSEIKTLHVNAQKLDLLVNQLGELILTKIRTEKSLEKIDNIKVANEIAQKDLLKTSNYLRYYNRKYLQNNGSEQYISAFAKQVFSLLSEVSQNVSKTIYDLNSLFRAYKEDDMKMRIIIDEMESMVKNIRVLPVSTVFNSFSRMVRDIASEKGKEIDFIIEGNETCADKKIIEEIKTPLIHILRNAIDHGIETQDERIANGKKPVGQIVLSARQIDNMIIIEVADDGRGFNLEKIKDRAVSRGFLTQEDIDSMTDEAIMNIIFWPGFTTGDSITSISGRGIGLDVVKTKISQLNGKVKVISEFGKGSIVRIEIPVTLTTLRVFLVDICGQTFAIPIQLINTFIVKKQSEIKTNNGVRSIVYNDNIIPLYYLSDILEISSETKRHEKETILIVEADEKTIGLVVDKLIGDQDILQKKLPPPLYKVKNISGVTNMSSGELCLILNMQDIMHYDFNKAMAMNAGQNLLTKDILAYKRILVVDDSITTRTMIKNILLNASYTADIVSSVEEAFSMLKAGHYDLIITDLHMPKIDGFEFVSMLKGDEMYSDIPVIVMSSLPEKEAAKTLAQYNIDYYICKENFNQEEFSNQIETILTKYHDY